MTQTARQMFLQTFDYTWDRLRRRLEGLTDEEYFWEPVANCWTVHPSQTGGYRMDRPVPASTEPAPVTTIAWRMCHIGGDVLMGFAQSLSSGRPPEIELEDWPGTADTAVAFVDRAYGGWREALEATQEDVMWKELGPAWGPFGQDSTADLVLHIFDEFVHHCAEVALLRDLFHARK